MSSTGSDYTVHALDTATRKTIWSKVTSADRSSVAKAFSAFFATLAPESREA